MSANSNRYNFSVWYNNYSHRSTQHTVLSVRAATHRITANIDVLTLENEMTLYLDIGSMVCNTPIILTVYLKPFDRRERSYNSSKIGRERCLLARWC